MSMSDHEGTDRRPPRPAHPGAHDMTNDDRFPIAPACTTLAFAALFLAVWWGAR